MTWTRMKNGTWISDGSRFYLFKTPPDLGHGWSLSDHDARLQGIPIVTRHRNIAAAKKAAEDAATVRFTGPPPKP